MGRISLLVCAAFGFLVAALLLSSASGIPASSSYRMLYAFTGSPDGADPQSDLTVDASGNLYGTTSEGGTGSCGRVGCGTVFELAHEKDKWRETVLYSFAGGADGFYPVGGVTFDHAGNLYGTTQQEGGNNGGTVFELLPNGKGGWTEKILYAFSSIGGPNSDLIFDKAGNLYGTLQGPSNQGAVFELSPSQGGTWTETTLHSFSGSPDGQLPSGAPVLDSQGNLYGLTVYGGTGKCYYGCGTVYELIPGSSGWTEQILYDFSPGLGLGKNPGGGPILDPEGDLYGTTEAGGDGPGMVFKLSKLQKQGWEQAVLFRFFSGGRGAEPMGRIAMDAKRNFYGSTYFSGRGTYGAIFRVNRPGPGPRETDLHTFAGGSDGAYPKGGVTMATGGTLYGTTAAGGGGNCSGEYVGSGTVYEVKP